MNVKEETNRGSIVERQHMRAVEADARHESEAGNNLRWPMEKKKMCGPPVTVTVRLDVRSGCAESATTEHGPYPELQAWP